MQWVCESIYVYMYPSSFYCCTHTFISMHHRHGVCLSNRDRIEMNMFSGFTPGNVLRQMAHLKKLHIKEYVADSQGTDWLTLDLLSAIPALEELRLENCYIEEENLRSKLTHLKHLEIIEN